MPLLSVRKKNCRSFASSVIKAQQATAPATAALPIAAIAGAEPARCQQPTPPPGSPCDLRWISGNCASSRRSLCRSRCFAAAVRHRRRTLVRAHRRRAQLSLRPPPCAQHRSLASGGPADLLRTDLAARSHSPLARTRILARFVRPPWPRRWAAWLSAAACPFTVFLPPVFGCFVASWRARARQASVLGLASARAL